MPAKPFKQVTNARVRYIKEMSEGEGFCYYSLTYQPGVILRRSEHDVDIKILREDGSIVTHKNCSPYMEVWPCPIDPVFEAAIVAASDNVGAAVVAKAAGAYTCVCGKTCSSTSGFTLHKKQCAQALAAAPKEAVHA